MTIQDYIAVACMMIPTALLSVAAIAAVAGMFVTLLLG